MAAFATLLLGKGLAFGLSLGMLRNAATACNYGASAIAAFISLIGSVFIHRLT